MKAAHTPQSSGCSFSASNSHFSESSIHKYDYKGPQIRGFHVFQTKEQLIVPLWRSLYNMLIIVNMPQHVSQSFSNHDILKHIGFFNFSNWFQVFTKLKKILKHLHNGHNKVVFSSSEDKFKPLTFELFLSRVPVGAYWKCISLLPVMLINSIIDNKQIV